MSGFTIKNGNENGLLLVDSSKAQLVDCIFPDNSYDLDLTNSMNIQIINTTFETVNFNDAHSDISVLWPIDLKVVDNRSGFIPNAQLMIKDFFGATKFDGYTDERGRISQMLIQEYSQNISAQIDYNLHTISVRKYGYLDFSLDLTIESYTRPSFELQNHIQPEASISGDLVQYVDMDSEIDFDGSESNGRSITHMWKFGDGRFSSSPTPSHTYTSPGAYQVNLTVTDDYFSTSKASIIVIVDNIYPTAQAETSMNSAVEEEEIQFDASNSWDTSSDSISFFWDFGDGAQSSRVSPTHIFKDEGEYAVSLTVMDLFGGKSTANLHISVTNMEPLITDINVTGMQYPGKPLNFTVIADDSPMDIPILQYAWDFGDGTIGYEQNVTHAFSEAGMFNVTVTVTDNNGASDSEDIPIIIADPEITTSVSSTLIFQDESVFFNASHELDDGSFKYTWNFGDSATDEWNYTSHTYVQSGIFSPYLIIYNGIENETIFLGEILVKNVIPTPTIVVGELLVREDESVLFNAINSMDSPSDYRHLTYVWDFNDYTTGVGVNVAHAYHEMGTYTVILTVSDGKTTNTTEVQIEVENIGPVANAGTPKDRKATTGQPVIFDASGTFDTPFDVTLLNYTWTIAHDVVYGRVVSYTFETAGDFTVTLTVRDDDGAESQDTITIEVSKSSTSDNDGAMGTISWILLLIIIVFLVVIGYLIHALQDEKLYKEMKAEQAEEKKLLVEEEAIVVEGTMDDDDFKKKDDAQEATVEVAEEQDGEISDATVEVGEVDVGEECQLVVDPVECKAFDEGGIDDSMFRPPDDVQKATVKAVNEQDGKNIEVEDLK